MRATLGGMVSFVFDEFQVDNIDQWRGLCPELHVEGNLDRTSYHIGDMPELLSDLRVEGYVQVPDVLPRSLFGPLADCVSLLHRSGIPTPFAFIYDEFWMAYQGVSSFMSAALGAD